jgi:hypothetical protein
MPINAENARKTETCSETLKKENENVTMAKINDSRGNRPACFELPQHTGRAHEKNKAVEQLFVTHTHVT